MITIDLWPILHFLFKVACLVVFSGTMALFILWPINDRPTSKGQYVTWGICVVIAVLFIFDVIALKI